MRLWKTYLQPKSVEDALAYLQSSAGRGAVIAGGTDLILDLAQDRHSPVNVLVDVSEIDEMRQVRREGDQIFLGAAVTHAEVVCNPILRTHAACLVEACGLIGGPQVRGIATIGGNVARALPAGDGSIALLALDAIAQVAGVNGREWRPLLELFAGPGETSLDRHSEVLVGFRIHARHPGEGSAFGRIMRPQGVAIAILNMAAWMQQSQDGLVREARIAIGPAGPRPFRARNTETGLVAKRLGNDSLREARKALLEEVNVRTSPHRATMEYRRHLAGILLNQTLMAAQARARE